MKNYRSATASVFVLVFLAVSAFGEVTQSQDLSAQDDIARPDRIIVYDFGATPADIPATAGITGYYDKRDTAQSTEEIALGRQLGSLAAARLVDKIAGMGLQAQRAGQGPAPGIGDILITGQFISIDEGDANKRIMIGFGKGKAKLVTRVEGYLVTPTGHRRLGARQTGTASGKKPGLGASAIMTAATGNPVGLVVNFAMTAKKEKGQKRLESAAKRAADQIAKELKVIFKEQGWI